MNVLLISPKFYSYDRKLKSEIERQGHTVDLFCEYKEKYSIFTRFISKKTKIKNNIRIQNAILNEIKRKKYDEILIIVGRHLTIEFMEKLKKQNPMSRFILYLWDSVGRCESFENIKKFFDEIFSFDRVDCKNYGFTFLPLFYTNDFKLIQKQDTSISIYGAFFAHSDRIEVVEKVASQVENAYFYIYFDSKVQLFNFLLNSNKNRQVVARNISISEAENIKHMMKAKCILDIHHPAQVGLTMRTIESVGCSKKLITTNQDIVNYDFYNPNNVLIISRENPIIPKDFIENDYVPISKEVYEKYSIESFIFKLLNVEEK